MARSRRARRDLTRAEVLRAAVTVAERDGLAGLTMRRVAAEVGVEAMSLYNHVADKEALLDGMVDVLVEQLELPGTTPDWRADVRAYAHAFRRLALRYPTTAPLVLTRQTYSPALLRVADAAIGRLLRAGFTRASAVHALHALLASVVGTLLREVGTSPALGEQDPAGRARRADLLRASGHHHLGEVAEELATLDRAAEFDFALTLLLESLDRRRDDRLGGGRPRDDQFGGDLLGDDRHEGGRPSGDRRAPPVEGHGATSPRG